MLQGLPCCDAKEEEDMDMARADMDDASSARS